MEQIKLDMIPKGIKPVCHASQYDVNRNIRLYLMDGMQGYTLTDETVEIHIRKPDNTVITAEVEYTTGSSYVDIITTQQMVAVSGKNLCELVIKKDTTVIGSLNFIMEVEHDPLDGGIESESEIHDLRSQVAADVALEVENQYDSNSVIFDDEATTGHGTGYVVSSEYIKDLEAEINEKANSADLATVATSGSFNDLTNKPVIDSSLSSSSTNAVQNKIVKSAVDAKANKADVFLLNGGTAITNNTNLNTITTPGSYYISGDSIMPTILNAPSSNSGKLEVFSSLGTGANYVRQVYTDWKTKQFVRYTTNGGGTWTAWNTVTTSDLLADLIPQNVFVYADGERQIGTWGNLGVYERILTVIDGTVGQEQHIDVSSWGIADVIKLTAMINRITAGKEFKYPLPFYESANTNGWCRWNSTDKTLDYMVNVENSTVKRFIVDYTK